jgi:transcriptional regulator with XRE-family HTH domain
MTVENFGKVISSKRKEKLINQNELAALIKKEDGSAISPQYLNDIERGRRNPPPEYIIKQLAKELDLSEDYLYFLAGKLPNNLQDDYSQNDVEAAMKAFRKRLQGDE